MRRQEMPVTAHTRILRGVGRGAGAPMTLVSTLVEPFQRGSRGSVLAVIHRHVVADLIEPGLGGPSPSP